MGWVLAAAVIATGAGCESLVPRRELAVMARTLPPGPEVSPAQQQAMLETIREETGVANFEFSQAVFQPEMQLPRSVAWVMGLFIDVPEGAQP